MVTLFTLSLLFFIALALFRSKFLVLSNELFWFVVFWTLIVGVYYSCGVEWSDRVELFSIIYIVVCLLLFVIFRYISIKRYSNKSIINIEHTFAVKETLNSNTITFYILLGVMGVVGFSFDYIRLNGLHAAKSTYSITPIGTISALFIPVLFVIGLYEFGKALSHKRISALALFLLILYTVPCILNSGRESFVYLLIALASTWSFNRMFEQNPKHLVVNVKKAILFLSLIVFVFIILIVIVKISSRRFGQTEIDVYLWKHNVPNRTQAEANWYGPFKSLFYNYISYFGHQIPFLATVIQKYKGPYLFGLYELNIISRRLPASLNLDYNLVYQSLERSLSVLEWRNFKGTWQTLIGSLIFDFSQYGAPMVIAVLGYLCGYIRSRYINTHELKYATLLSLICFSMFASIQLGPFYNFLVYGTFIWWIVIFKFRISIKF